MTEHGDRYRAEGFWRDEILTDYVRRWARGRGKEVAVIDGNRRLTWAQLWDAAGRAAASLADEGIQPGDIVSTQLPNGAEIVVLHLACELVGAVHNPLAIQFRQVELDQIASLVDPSLVVHPGTVGGRDYEALHAVTTAGSRGLARNVNSLVDMFAGEPIEVSPSPSRATDHAFILNTSGTVSIKGVVHSHEEAMYSTRTVGELMDLGADDTIICAIPMTWGGGLAWGVRIALHLGATLVSLDRWDARRAAEHIDAEGGSFIYGPPTVARDLVGLADEWRPSGDRGLKMICAGAPIPRQLVRDAHHKLGMTLIPGYGQTEHLHSTLGRLDDPEEKITGTDGRALPGVEVRAVGDDGRPCPPGVVGALQCRGPNVSVGYYAQPDLTAEIFLPDGWQVTNDLGSFDADGYLSVMGRERDIIIRGGLNVSPREVEELLLRHPGIAEVAVVGYPDERYGERVCAFVVPAGSHAPSLDDVTSMLEEQGVARYKHPERLEAIDELPLTTTGKVRHATLREQLAQEARAP